MKVILLADVPALGRKNEVKEVSGGYARNFLLPQRLAEPAADAALAALAAKKERAQQEKSKEHEQQKAAVEKLKGLVLHLKIKVGEKGKAFGSINAAKIQEALVRQGIHVEKDWVQLDGPIKSTGEKTVAVQFPHGIKSEVSIIVEAEKPDS